MEQLPLELAGESSRPVDSDTPYAYAWGEPPVVLVCGVERPAALVPTSPLIQISGVNWLVDTTDPRPDRLDRRRPAGLRAGHRLADTDSARSPRSAR
jgi:hypothetical protein